MERMALPDVETETFAVRYRLTDEDARSIVWIGVLDGLGVLIGMGLLALVATASAFGIWGRIATFGVPAYVGWKVLSAFQRTRKAIDPEWEITTTFSAAGVRHEGRTSHSFIAWAGFRQIARHKAGWVFTSRAGHRFFVPARAIPTEARAPIARWASAAKVRLA
jgi:hypothetical protein